MKVFFGTSKHSAQFLEKITQNEMKFDLVVSGPPKPIGKKQILTENPTVTMAKKLNIPFADSIDCHSSVYPGKESWNLYRSQIKSGMTLGLILDFNQIIPAEVISLFPKGIINIHFSKLPQYRGAAPVQHTILNGDKEAWITYYLIDEKVDTGKILKQTSLALDLTENTQSLYQKLIDKTTEEVGRVVDEYLAGKITPQPQEGIPSFAKKLKVENCQIDWSKPPLETERLIRAAYPEPGAWASAQICSSSAKIPTEKHLKILKAHLEGGKLVMDQVQLEGKNPVSFKQFCEGYPNFQLI